MPVVLALLCAAQFMVVLDVSVVNVALPCIQHALGFDARHLAWVGNAYALSFGVLLLLGGRLADAPGWLIAARAGQGVGAAVLAPATLTILTSVFPEGPRRTRAIAIWTAVSLAGGTAGNLIGGALTEYLSWRAILLINVPIGLVCLAVTRRLAAGPDMRGERRLDVLGAVLATAGLAALAYGLSGAPAVTLAGAVLLGLFALVEVRVARAPLIPPHLVRARPIWLGNIAMLLAGACLNPMW